MIYIKSRFISFIVSNPFPINMDGFLIKCLRTCIVECHKSDGCQTLQLSLGSTPCRLSSSTRGFRRSTIVQHSSKDDRRDEGKRSTLSNAKSWLGKWQSAGRNQQLKTMPLALSGPKIVIQLAHDNSQASYPLTQTRRNLPFLPGNLYLLSQ
jgi:hypothetical protein